MTWIRRSPFIILLICPFVCIFPDSALAASFNFQASATNLLAGDEVTFTFTFDSGEEAPADRLTIALDLDGDNHSEYIKSYEAVEGAFEDQYTMTIAHPGYYDAEVRYTITQFQEDGDESETSKSLGPLRLNVAKWRFTDDDTLGCIESSPALSPDGSVLYIGSENGGVYALDSATGKLKWKFMTGGPVNAAPLVDGSGNIYVGSVDGTFYAIDKDGYLNWEFRTKEAIFASAALDSELEQIYMASCDHVLYAMDMKSGTLVWRYQTDDKLMSSPVIGHDKTVYIGSLDHYLYALSPLDGALKWRFKTGNQIYASPALDSDGTLYIGTASFRGAVNEENAFHALSSTGLEKWSVKNIHGFSGSAVISPEGTLCVASFDNNLYGIARSGEDVVNFKNFSDESLSTGAIGSNDYLYIASQEGILFGLSITEGNSRDGRDVLWQYDLEMPITTSAPVIGQSTVFIGACAYERGAIMAFCADLDPEETDIIPSDESPWPQFRNDSQNRAITPYTTATVAPEIVSVHPVRGEDALDLERRSVSVTFSKSMAPESLYTAPNPDEEEEEGFFGFTVQPFDGAPEAFIQSWNDTHTVLTLTLPEGLYFKPDVVYTATVLSKAFAAEMGDDDPNGHILYAFSWTFSHTIDEPVVYDYSPGGCFISSLLNNLTEEK